MNSLNQFFDSIPQPRLGRYGREVPTYRACGIAGFYLAVIAALGGALLAGHSLLVTVQLAIICASSFYVYAYLRMWIVGCEVMVLLEHVWFAFGCAALVLWLLGESVLSYLEIVSTGMCFFLAAGRVGCTMVGCCHGRPSSFGVAYNEACVRDGFPSHLVGIRLFPVPVIEAIGLLFIGLTSLSAFPFAAPGKIFVWFLLAYSVMRFGLEGLRGDRRPHLLGLSQARWMCLTNVVVALYLAGGELTALAFATCIFLFASLFFALSLPHHRNSSRRWLTAAHMLELRTLVSEKIHSPPLHHLMRPVSCLTSQGVSVAISSAGRAFPSVAHISLALPERHHDLSSLCELGASAFPESLADAAQVSGGRVLHLLVPAPLTDDAVSAQPDKQLATSLYGHVVRRMQCSEAVIRGEEFPSEAPPLGGDPSVSKATDVHLWRFQVGSAQRGR